MHEGDPCCCANPEDEPWRALWAKTDRDTNRWLPLPCHLLNVAATAEALWERLPMASRAVPLATWPDSADARAALAFLAAGHDIGKANRYFQAKDRRQHQRLTALGLDLPPFRVPAEEQYGHGQATGAHLKPWLQERWGWDGLAAYAVALAVGGHHGRFADQADRSTLRVGEEPWLSAGAQLLDALAAALRLPPDLPAPVPLNPFLGWLAGYVCVADWLGSHEGMTVWHDGAPDFGAYLAAARLRAAALLDSLQWVSPAGGVPLTLADMLPDGVEPNALQQACARIAPGFRLAVVEAPTGEGKTEAAFALTEAARSQGAGAYFALPTMATANGLQPRVKRYLARATGDADIDLQLLHSQAWLYRDDVRTAGRPEEPDDEARTEDWFAGAKRGLIAPYGVGTVDQTLIGALRARHGFVRLFALAGKTVVVDEVHAYDVYMSDLLDTLLGWLRVLGCRVVLLSATLPAARREAILRAWGARGAPSAVYPCVTWADADGAARTETVAVRPRKPLTIGPVVTAHAAGEAPAETWQTGAARILDRVRRAGGVGALVVNTVRDAQRAHEWLSRTAPAGIALDLFHARFTADDRAAVERRVLAQFGKQRQATDPSILVATQVVEQSLDLDFDAMVSALAPMDLLIQRAGRLHRHPRYADGTLRADGGLDGRPDPVLEVVLPPRDAHDVPELTEIVYAADVLLRTARAISPQNVIARPADVAAAIEQVYGGLDPEGARQAWLDRYASAAELTARKAERRHGQADDASIPHAAGRVPLTNRSMHLDDDEEGSADADARTRLEDLPSIALVVLAAGDPEPAAEPKPEERRRLAGKTLRCSAAGDRLAELRDLPAPAGWRRAAGLRHARLARLDAHGRFRTPSFTYHYSPTTGLSWEHRDANA